MACGISEGGSKQRWNGTTDETGRDRVIQRLRAGDTIAMDSGDDGVSGNTFAGRCASLGTGRGDASFVCCTSVSEAGANSADQSPPRAFCVGWNNDPFETVIGNLPGETHGGEATFGDS